MIRKLKHFLVINYNTISFLNHERKLLIKHLGSSNNRVSKEKFKALIIIQSHVIEKGLSLNVVKIGFGETKIKSLINDLSEYFLRFQDVDFCVEILSILDAYFQYNSDNRYKNQQLFEEFQKLVDVIKHDFSKIQKGGIIHITKEQILEKANIDFEGFINSRYSIRDFSDIPVDTALVMKALRMSWKTPSACNRQPWKAHVMKSKSKVFELLDFQTGARQFKDQIGCAVLITASYNSFFNGEFHQPYVNGGLFAMTFIYALHSFGLGTIALNMGFEHSKLKLLKTIIDIQEDEVPILLIGIGNLPNELNVACSNRFKPDEYIKIY